MIKKVLTLAGVGALGIVGGYRLGTQAQKVRDSVKNLQERPVEVTKRNMEAYLDWVQEYKKDNQNELDPHFAISLASLERKLREGLEIMEESERTDTYVLNIDERERLLVFGSGLRTPLATGERSS